ncbi:MAG: DUF1827 family protein [Lactobacillus sp.]|jgi:hypothetical protein|nr:DUF1827 family protein [Lactobacillus sp.]MCH3906625.1 DUF1827 family protein [Lactobacillus sp.]MCH3989739.1 DUF1827 family protein [Lactobacillus sp.]MCH4068095.1 DUF1827 family protein [Lactobacillus sp.]MCI1304276.1 DUF1827 family protein [Lactobacillus sp.]
MNYLVDVSAEHPELGKEVYKIGNTFIIVTRQTGRISADLSNRHHRIRAEEVDLTLAQLFSDYDEYLIKLDKERRHVIISNQ